MMMDLSDNVWTANLAHTVMTLPTNSLCLIFSWGNAVKIIFLSRVLINNGMSHCTSCSSLWNISGKKTSEI